MFSLLLVIVSGVGDWISLRALMAIQGQLDEMKSGAVDTHSLAQAAVDSFGLDRAWIGTPEIKPGQKSNGIYEFTYTVRNTGRTVVRGLYIGAEIVEVRKIILEDEIKKCLSEYSKINDIYNLVPGDRFVIADDPANSHIDTHFDINDWRAKHGDARPAVLGCVLYGPKANDRLHQTAFVGVINIDGDKIDVDRSWSSLTE